MKQEQIDAIGELIKEQYEFTTKGIVTEETDSQENYDLLNIAKEWIKGIEDKNLNFKRFALAGLDKETLEDAFVEFYRDVHIYMKNYVWKFIADKSLKYKNLKEIAINSGWEVYAEKDLPNQSAGIFFKKK